MMLLTNRGIYAARDRMGRTPLVIGRKEGAYSLTFETCALPNLGYDPYRELGPGEIVRVDTGCLVAFQESVDYDIQFVGGFKNALFGGEGLFLATLRGPGRVYLQTLPFSRLADRLKAAVGRNRGEHRGAGGLGGSFVKKIISGD